MSKADANPIVALFRADEHRIPTKKRPATDPATRGLRAGVLVNRLGRGILPARVMDATPEQVEFARRVLGKFSNAAAHPVTWGCDSFDDYEKVAD